MYLAHGASTRACGLSALPWTLSDEPELARSWTPLHMVEKFSQHRDHLSHVYCPLQQELALKSGRAVNSARSMSWKMDVC